MNADAPATVNPAPVEPFDIGRQVYLNIAGIQHPVLVTRVAKDEDGILRYGLRVVGSKQRFHGIEAEWVSSV